MTSRLRLRYGALHIEYEGSDEFLKTEMPALLEQIARVLPGASTGQRPIQVHMQDQTRVPSQSPQAQAYLGTVKF